MDQHTPKRGRARALARLERFCTGPRSVLWSAALGALLAAPSLFIGLAADDFTVRTIIKGFPGFPPIDVSWHECFTFADGDPEQNRMRVSAGFHPWWAHPELRMAFFRPFAAVTHWIDFKLLDAHPWLMHVQNLLWYALLCVAAGLLYRRFSELPFVAGMSALIFAIDDAHGIPAGWIAGRNAVLTALGAVLTLIAHDAWRRNPSRRAGMLLGPAAFVFALAGGEAAIGVCAYLFAYALFLDKAPPLDRALALVPYAAIAGAYLGWYRAAGYGSSGNDTYADPAGQPLAFALAVAQHLPVLLHAQYGLMPAGPFLLFTPLGKVMAVLSGVVFLALLLVVVYPVLKTNRAARFWLVGSTLATLPVCTTIPVERLLMLTGVGAAPLIAQCIYQYRWSPGAADSPSRTRRGALRRFGAGFLFFAHVVIAPIAFLPSSISMLFLQSGLDRGYAQVPDTADVANQSIIWLNPPFDSYAGWFPPARQARGQTIPRHTWVLVTGARNVRATRVDQTTLEASCDLGFFHPPYGVTFRGHEQRLRPGDQVTVEDFTAEVTAANDAGFPTRIRFRFNEPLENAQYRWYAYGLDGLKPYTPPPIGQSTEHRLGSVINRLADW